MGGVRGRSIAGVGGGECELTCDIGTDVPIAPCVK